MDLAKPCIDVGLNTNNGDAMLLFWRETVGLPYEGALPVRRGIVQHRFDCDGSIVKINVYEAPLPPEQASGYREVLVAKPQLAAPVPLQDPDGNRVCLWPMGLDGVEQLGVRLGVRSLSHHRKFLADMLGQEEELSADAATTAFAIGRSRLIVEEAHDAAADTGFGGAGWRYITLQVFNVDEVHAQLVAGGAREALAPRTLGAVARISMVLDPDGNWIELSQRASLVGSLN
ncbi:MAG: hypothetical protein JWR80_1762 [Bradyrhizobium sp.]|nr:hypothetical protein [Bradyrhizobium sp.]